MNWQIRAKKTMPHLTSLSLLLLAKIRAYLRHLNKILFSIEVVAVSFVAVVVVVLSWV